MQIVQTYVKNIKRKQRPVSQMFTVHHQHHHHHRAINGIT